MNDISEQIEKTIEKKRLSKKYAKELGDEEERKKAFENFSFASFFASEEYNQELAKHNEILQSNIIDFGEEENRKKELVENKIKEITSSSANRKLIEQEEFPVIWFKNIDKIAYSSPLQKSLLAIFDPAQNHSLSIEGKMINLSQFVLIATSSTNDTGKLSNPLFSRLDCINVDTARPKEFF